MNFSTILVLKKLDHVSRITT
jgi:hypothetical protein